jgi:3-oxoacyl-[acyl-carrier protein] reductase
MQIGGTNIIVTGAAGGIGRAVVRMLLDSGAKKIGVMGRSPDKLEALVTELGLPDRMMTLGADVTDEEAVGSAIAGFVERAGRLDALINGAGILLDGALFSVTFKGISRYPIENWERTLRTNATGTFLCTRAAVEQMVRKRAPGVIVNVSSIARMGYPGQTAYSASKGAVASLTRTWAKELAPLKIRCCAIAPGMIDTPMAQAVPDKRRQDVIAAMAAGRLGTPAEVAHAVQFCLENDFFSGKVLELDGGTFA